MKKISRNKLLALFTVTAIMVLSMTTVVFAGATPAPYDMTTAIETGMNNLVTQILGIIAVVVPSVLVIVGGKMAITKGIGVMKSLVNKG